jgi:hypothetical protein
MLYFAVKNAAGISNYSWQGSGVIHFELPSREFALLAVTKREECREMG